MGLPPGYGKGRVVAVVLLGLVGAYLVLGAASDLVFLKTCSGPHRTDCHGNGWTLVDPAAVDGLALLIGIVFAAFALGVHRRGRPKAENAAP